MDEENEPTLEEKQKYNEELFKFTQDVDEKVKELCSYFGFDFDNINKHREPFITCPFNSGHTMPERSLEKHLQKCEWNTLGYTKDCKPLPESAVPAESPSTIKFDMELQYQILKQAKEKNPELNIGDQEKFIPKTSDRLMSDFTIDERRAMYDYVIANTVAPDVGKDITNMNNEEKKEESNSTILELLQQERNLKRRRAKYKGVHTNKKTHTEILKEVVDQQMEMYKEFVSEKYGIPIPDENNYHDRHLKNKSERQTSRSSRRRTRSRSKDKKNFDKRSKNTSNDRKHEDRSRDNYNGKSRDRSKEKKRNKREKSRSRSRDKKKIKREKDLSRERSNRDKHKKKRDRSRDSYKHKSKSHKYHKTNDRKRRSRSWS